MVFQQRQPFLEGAAPIFIVSQAAFSGQWPMVGAAYPSQKRFQSAKIPKEGCAAPLPLYLWRGAAQVDVYRKISKLLRLGEYPLHIFLA
jgi:hypothetical protein